jgi:hypothetical protein
MLRCVQQVDLGLTVQGLQSGPVHRHWCSAHLRLMNQAVVTLCSACPDLLAVLCASLQLRLKCAA